MDDPYLDTSALNCTKGHTGVVCQTHQMNRFPNRLRAGVTRTEVVFAVAAAAVIVLVAYGFQFRTRFVSEQARCKQNMKDVVLGYLLWKGDHHRLPWMVELAEGGNLGLDPALTRQSWFQFSWISNELASPRALADPADKRKGLRVATLWGSDPNGGLSSEAFRNNACSYGLGIDVNISHSGPMLGPPFDMAPNPILLVDRHISNNGRTDCIWFRGLMMTNVATVNDAFSVKWRNEVHGKGGGNLGFMDGSVHYVTNPRLTNCFYFNIAIGTFHLNAKPDAKPEAHFLFPD